MSAYRTRRHIAQRARLRFRPSLVSTRGPAELERPHSDAAHEANIDLTDFVETAEAPGCEADVADAVAQYDDFADELELQIEQPAADECGAAEEPAPADEDCACDEPEALAGALADDETEDPPFDPPDEDDEIFGNVSEEEVDESVALEAAQPPVPTGPLRAPRVEPVTTPAPAIFIDFYWDTSGSADLFSRLAADPRMSRTTLSGDARGVDGAFAKYSREPSPDLLIVESSLSASQLPGALERLTQVIDPRTKLLVIGHVNDVGLLRELARRGVSQYLLAPANHESIVRSIGELYVDTEHCRVLAVVGARGGVGASTIAYNLAWSIAERRDISTTLVDLDFSFGATAISPQRALGEGAVALAQAGDDGWIDRPGVQRTRRLRLLSGALSLDQTDELDAEAVVSLLKCVRRSSAFVVLDVPHGWNPWIKDVLVAADEVLIVAAPDLASMRNAKSLLDALKSGRRRDNVPLVALSMVGAPKRPEISAKDIANAIGAEPVASFAFDPALFGVSEINDQTVIETAPRSQAATTLEAIATLVSGREPRTWKRERPAAVQAPAVNAPEKPAPQSQDAGPRPFTFVADAEPAQSPAPLLLVDVAVPKDPRSTASVRVRASAQRVMQAANDPRSKMRRRGRPGTIRVAAALAALLIATIWYAQNRAAAASAPAPARAHRAAVVTHIDPREDYNRALPLLAEGRVSDALPLLQSAAVAGMPSAQYRLAKLYEIGKGVAADLPTARRWTERAAVGGNVRAMHDLGVYFANGDAGPRNDAEAFRWFREAAEYDIPESQYNLGLLYDQGRGVEPNPQEALFWLLVAARSGDQAAQTRADVIAAQISPFDAEQVRARVADFRPRRIAADEG